MDLQLSNVKHKCKTLIFSPKKLLLRTAGKHSVEEDVDVVVVENIDDYLDYIKIQRGITDKDIHLRWGFDNGQEFYKVCINVLDKSPKESSKEMYGSDYKDTGVKRLNII